MACLAQRWDSIKAKCRHTPYLKSIAHHWVRETEEGKQPEGQRMLGLDVPKARKQQNKGGEKGGMQKASSPESWVKSRRLVWSCHLLKISVSVHKMVPWSPCLSEGLLLCKVVVRSSMFLNLFTLENHRDCDRGFSDLQQGGMHALAAFSSWIVRDALYFLIGLSERWSRQEAGFPSIWQLSGAWLCRSPHAKRAQV